MPFAYFALRLFYPCGGYTQVRERERALYTTTDRTERQAQREIQSFESIHQKKARPVAYLLSDRLQRISLLLTVLSRRDKKRTNIRQLNFTRLIACTPANRLPLSLKANELGALQWPTIEWRLFDQQHLKIFGLINGPFGLHWPIHTQSVNLKRRSELLIQNF